MKWLFFFGVLVLCVISYAVSIPFQMVALGMPMKEDVPNVDILNEESILDEDGSKQEAEIVENFFSLRGMSSCTDQCNHSVRQVCGSDNVTYLNPCYFKCAQMTKPGLTIKHMGKC